MTTHTCDHQSHAQSARRLLVDAGRQVGAPAELGILLRAVVESNLANYELHRQEMER